MNGISTYRRSAIIITVIAVSVFLLTECINKTGNGPAVIKNAAGQEFAGSLACMSCHKNIYDSNIHTAHYRTSQAASGKNIKGSFDKGKNTVVFNGQVKVGMEKRDSSFYQVEYINGEEKTRQRFDIVIGAGKKGQTFLYWMEDRLMQLPVFYFTARDQWANSPGFPGRVIFKRPITSRCLECHSTYAQKTSAENIQPEEFSHHRVIYGVDCERCHGPSARHVEFQLKNPKDTTGKYIIVPEKFTRAQKLDMCALCHSGSMNGTKPPFSFQAGDKLSDFYSYNTIAADIESLDVHGNQYGLLSLSKCFIQSEMTCNSCHSPHANEEGQTVLFSQRCMTCHNKEHGNFCKVANVPGSVLAQNCIDCHMPEQASKAIVFLEEGTNNQVAATMRSHLIKIYPEQTNKVLAFIKQTQR
ncbi:MAG: multiheme c-type cytochrome [Bacteroidota bacterium]